MIIKSIKIEKAKSCSEVATLEFLTPEVSIRAGLSSSALVEMMVGSMSQSLLHMSMNSSTTTALESAIKAIFEDMYLSDHIGKMS